MLGWLKRWLMGEPKPKQEPKQRDVFYDVNVIRPEDMHHEGARVYLGHDSWIERTRMTKEQQREWLGR